MVIYIGREAAEKILDLSTPVFGLSSRQIGRRVQLAARAAGLGDGFTGHSDHVGMAQDLRWKSTRMPARYTERQAAGRGAVARYCQEHGGQVKTGLAKFNS